MILKSVNICKECFLKKPSKETISEGPTQEKQCLVPQAEEQPLPHVHSEPTGTAAWRLRNRVGDFTKLTPPIGDELMDLWEVRTMIWWSTLCHEVDDRGQHHFLPWPQVPLLCHGRAGLIRPFNGAAQGGRINMPLFTWVSDFFPLFSFSGVGN